MVGDLLKMMSAVNSMRSDYESRKLGRFEPETKDGVTVSTAYTPDMGYETALLDDNGTYPVERYSTKEEAEVGHTKWVEFAKTANGKTITMLGYGGLIENEEVTLCRE